MKGLQMLYPMPRDATAFDRAALTLDLLSDGPWVEIGTRLWSELSREERTELHRRASKRDVELRNPIVTDPNQ